MPERRVAAVTHAVLVVVPVVLRVAGHLPVAGRRAGPRRATLSRGRGVFVQSELCFYAFS